MRTAPVLLLFLLALIAGAWLVFGPSTTQPPLEEPESAAALEPGGPEPATLEGPGPEPGRRESPAAPRGLALLAQRADGRIAGSARFYLQRGSVVEQREAPGGRLRLPPEHEVEVVLAFADGHWSAARSVDGAEERDGTLRMVADHPAGRIVVDVDRSALPGQSFRWGLQYAGGLSGEGEAALRRGRLLSLAQEDHADVDRDRFAIEDLPAGLWSVRVQCALSPPATGSARLEAGGEAPLTVRLRPGGWIAGALRSAGGEELLEPRVFALPPNQMLETLLSTETGPEAAEVFGQLARQGAEARPGPEGSFRLGPVAPGEYRLIALAAGHRTTSSERPVRVEAGRTAVVALPALQLERGLAVQVLSGRDGQPVAGAEVRFRPLGRGGDMLGNLRPWKSAGVPTDERGQVRLEGIATDRLRLQVTAGGFALHEEEIHVDPTPGSSHEVRLLPALRLTGQVITRSGRRPIAGAQVTPRPGRAAFDLLSGFRESRDHAALAGKTDDRGRFALEGMSEGVWEVEVRAEGYAPGLSLPVELRLGHPAPDLTVELGIGGSVLVRVLDPDGEPEAEREVTLFGLDSRDSRVGRSDERGELRFDHLNPGLYQVASFTLGEGGFGSMLAGGLSDISSRSDFVDVGEDEQVEVVLGGLVPRTILQGFVTRGGAPVDGLTVLVTSASAFQAANTEGDGFYEVGGLPAGQYMVTVGDIQLGSGSGYTTVVELRGEPTRQLDIELPETGIRVRVLDATSGEPISGVPVFARLEGNTQGGGFKNTDSDGLVEFESLNPGTYLVAAGPNTMPFFGVRGSWSTETVGGVVLTEGARGLEELTIRLGPPASLRARVLGTDGRPVQGAGVFYLDESGQPISMFTMHGTDGDGWQLLENLPEGPGEVLARHPQLGEVRRPVDLVAGQEREIELQLETGTVVSVLVTDPAGEVLPGVQALLIDASGAPVSTLWTGMDAVTQGMKFLMGGEQRLGPVGPGEYKVLLAQPGRDPVRHPIRVEAGVPEMRLTLQFDPAAGSSDSD